jgi:DNA-binding transcriptional regulator YdaS (Cro superfamily)
MDKLNDWIKAERGRLVELAGACKITHSAVWQWERVPAEHVLTVEGLTGISRHELRPDIFGPAEAAA